MFYCALEGTYPYHTDPLDWLVSGLSLGYTACHNQVFVEFLCPFNCISEVIFWWVLYCAAVQKPQISSFWIIYKNNRQKRQNYVMYVSELSWLYSTFIQTQLRCTKEGTWGIWGVGCWCLRLFNAVLRWIISQLANLQWSQTLRSAMFVLFMLWCLVKLFAALGFLSRTQKLISRHQQYQHVGNEKHCDV